MKTEIRFLRELREDLAEAAEAELRGASFAFRGGRKPRRAVQLVGAVAGVLLAVSGVVGCLATEHGSVANQASGGGGVAGGHSVDKNQPDRPSRHGSSYGRNGIGTPSLMPSARPSTPPAGRRGIVEGGSGDSPASTPPPPGAPTKVVKTARLELRIPKGTFKERFSEALRIADTFGGYVQTSSTGGDKLRFGGMILRVPVGDFENALRALRGLGDVERQQVAGHDVTQEFVDLQARLRNALVEEARLRQFLREAPDVESSLRVNNVLSQIELQIEQLRGQIRYLQNRADLSTIDLELAEKAPKEKEKPKPKPPAKPTHESFGGAWHKAVDGFFGIATSVVVGLGYIVPLSVVVLLGGAIVWVLARLVRNRLLA